MSLHSHVMFQFILFFIIIYIVHHLNINNLFSKVHLVIKVKVSYVVKSFKIKHSK